MSANRSDVESEVSDDLTAVPVQIQHALGIEDGDRLRWHLEDTDSVRVQVVESERETFDEFEGYGSDEATDVTSDHDAWGVDTG